MIGVDKCGFPFCLVFYKFPTSGTESDLLTNLCLSSKFGNFSTILAFSHTIISESSGDAQELKFKVLLKKNLEWIYDSGFAVEH